ncbi:HPr family phosphocarrier protein [Streptomyces sp. NPDC049627]|uniref:HPr family phosphocarrier protein n=1 Tax=Streptomyces sp. NPDC049627 TaxID=3365595 RepID=UPI0037A52B87
MTPPPAPRPAPTRDGRRPAREPPHPPRGPTRRAAAAFTSAIQLEYADRTVNPTGVLAVMGLGATVGSTVTVRAEGHDAEQAVAALAQILATA